MKSLLLMGLVPVLAISAVPLKAQTNWCKYEGNPLLEPGPPGAWDDTRVTPDTVMLDGGIYHMWYTGWDGSPNGNFQIGHATSDDGITWTRNAANPVVEVGVGGEWDTYAAAHAVVLKDGDIYRMWYSGGDGSTVRGVGYAESPDGITWSKYGGNPVLQQGSGGAWDSWSAHWCAVIKEDSTYKMWYSGGSSFTSHQIGYATSPDGVTWSKYAGNPVLGSEHSGSWDDQQVWFPYVMKDGSTYRMWYGGNDGANNRIGYASSGNGISWRVHECNPVLDLGPVGAWDDNGVGVGCVLREGERWRMWYSGGAADAPDVKQIGYATSASCSGDLDGDGDLDIGDFALFQLRFTGPQP